MKSQQNIGRKQNWRLKENKNGIKEGRIAVETKNTEERKEIRERNGDQDETKMKNQLKKKRKKVKKLKMNAEKRQKKKD